MNEQKNSDVLVWKPIALSMRKPFLAFALVLMFTLPVQQVCTQTLEEQLSQLDQKLETLRAQQSEVATQVEAVKLNMIQRDLKNIGLPSENYIMHSALALEYAEAHEQARWVAHIILPDIKTGTVYRTNDFRVDPLVTSGTAVEADYFLKYLQPDSSYKYDGFGYDRGHLAPSADFRWSKKALSESYFYSNMSPQVAEFNREGWAELEGLLRGYLYNNSGVQLYVVTGPVLSDDLKPVERSINKVSVPKKYFKVAVDLKNKRAVGFIMPNEKIGFPLEHYVVTVDQVEELTGLDFFNQLDEPLETTLEKTLEKEFWFPELSRGDAEALYQPKLPPNHFNTVVAKSYMGRGDEITVCGRVVGTRYSRSGNLWLNLDKKFPNQIFSVFVRKKDLVNFGYDPKKEFDGKEVWFKGIVEDFNGTPTMNIVREDQVTIKG